MNNGTQSMDPVIESVLGGLDPSLASIIGNAPPPPIDQGSLSPKDQRAQVKTFEREVNAFNNGTVDKMHLRKFGDLARMVPNAQRIRIRKRLDTGNLGHIGEYNFRDLASSGDTEAFVSRNIKPTHGPGEYDITIIDGHGREFPAGSVFMIGAPIDGNGGSGMVDLVRDLVNRSSQVQQPQADPFDQMRKAQALAKELKESGGGGDSSAMLAAMMMQQQRPTGPDPMLLSVLERLTAKIEKIEQAAAAPPPMLPPPPAAPATDWVGAIATIGGSVVLPLLQMMQANQQSQMQTLMALTQSKETFGMRDALALMNESQARASQDKLSTRDIIDLLQRKNEEAKPQNSIEDQMEALMKMREFASAFSPPAGPQGASFWDALVALASSGDVAGAMADRIRSRSEPQQPQQPQRPALPANSGAQVIQFPQQQRPAQQTQSLPTPGRQQAPQIPIPDHLAADCEKIAKAEDSGGRVQAVIETLVALHKHPHFKQFVMALLESTAKGEKEATMRGLGGWLGMLEKNGLLPREVALAVLQDFHENWDLIRTILVEKVPFLQGIASSAPPAPEAPATPAAPAAPSDPSIPAEVEMPPGYGDEQVAEPAVV